jgi:flagellar biosynthesis protein FlhA
MASNLNRQPGFNPSGLVQALKQPEILLAIGTILVIAMMIIPLPAILLDIFLLIDIAAGMMVLLIGLNVNRPLEFSSFPSVLLILTLFRLALNISSTRLILLKAEAGNVIHAFGNFVVGGNYAVGIIIFIILIVINFIVVTNGAGRISEVAARFTLDAMPGKQMAIDADMNAGLINEADARKRRSDVQREADFYGTMDGASKFVKGDAIAAIIIIVVNILGGLAIGVFQRGMNAVDAAGLYTLLTVGEGLVSQIPALLISVGTGVLVSKVATETSLGAEIGSQLLGDPKALAAVAVLMALLGLVPGLPTLLLLGMAGIFGYAAYITNQQSSEAALQEALGLGGTATAQGGAGAGEEGSSKGPEDVRTLLNIDPMELEIGYRLIPLVDAQQGGDLLERITMIRRQTATKLGIVLPPIRVRDNLQLKPKEYRINLRGIQIAGGEIQIDNYLAMNAGMAVGTIDGIPTTEPVFGLPAFWIAEVHKEEAELQGFQVFDPSSVVATHLTEVIKAHAPDILTRQDVQSLLDNVKTTYPAVIGELLPDLLSVGEIQRVLQNLLKERVSIRDLPPVLEALATYSRLTKDTDTLTEYARQALARAITANYISSEQKLPVITLDPGLEQILGNAIQQTDQGAFVTLEPGIAQKLLKNVQTQMERVLTQGHQPVFLCSSKVRLVFRRLIERKYPQAAVLSYNEIVPPQTEINAIGTVTLG